MEVREQVVELAYHLARSGFLDRSGIVSEIVEMVEADDAATIAFVGRSVDEAFRKQSHVELFWNVTDNDRLARAAVELEANGILFRENFTCCQTCGFAEIGHEVSETEALGSKVRGFAFFHWQDTEGAVTGHGLNLSYGAVGQHDESSYEAAALAIAHEVTETIEREGLSVRRPEGLTSRIALEFTWKRRRFTAPPLVELDA